MGARGELFSARVKSKNDRRTYFFNLKENRNNDMFLTVVESKKTGEAEVFDRHQIVVFEEDLPLFRKGLETVLEYIDQRTSRAGGSGARGPARRTRLRRKNPDDDRIRSGLPGSMEVTPPGEAASPTGAEAPPASPEETPSTQSGDPTT